MQEMTDYISNISVFSRTTVSKIIYHLPYKLWNGMTPVPFSKFDSSEKLAIIFFSQTSETAPEGQEINDFEELQKGTGNIIWELT